MEALIVALILIGVVSLINDAVTNPTTENNIGDSSKPSHEKVIRKTN